MNTYQEVIRTRGDCCFDHIIGLYKGRKNIQMGIQGESTLGDEFGGKKAREYTIQ